MQGHFGPALGNLLPSSLVTSQHRQQAGDEQLGFLSYKHAVRFTPPCAVLDERRHPQSAHARLCLSAQAPLKTGPSPESSSAHSAPCARARQAAPGAVDCSHRDQSCCSCFQNGGCGKIQQAQSAHSSAKPCPISCELNSRLEGCCLNASPTCCTCALSTCRASQLHCLHEMVCQHASQSAISLFHLPVSVFGQAAELAFAFGFFLLYRKKLCLTTS